LVVGVLRVDGADPLARWGRCVVRFDHLAEVPGGPAARFGYRHVDAVLHAGAFGDHRPLHRPRGIDAKLALRTLLSGRVGRHGGDHDQSRGCEYTEPSPPAHSVPSRIPTWSATSTGSSAPAGCWRGCAR